MILFLVIVDFNDGSYEVIRLYFSKEKAQRIIDEYNRNAHLSTAKIVEIEVQ